MKKEAHIQNEVIVLGGNHHNELGIIRSLGEVGCKVYFIAVNVKNSFVVKSKYITDYWFAFEEDDLLDILLQKFSDGKLKPIIIPSNDDTVAILDKNLDVLKKKFILPNIKNQENAILKQMNKMQMTNLAEKHGFLVPKGFIFNLNDIENLQSYLDKKEIEYPCIVKPLQSLEGPKSDIIINNNINELAANLKKVKDKYNEVLIQEYIRKEEEVGVQGLAQKDAKIIIPSVIKRIRESSTAPSTTYAKLINPQMPVEIEKLKSMIKDLEYKGIFDVDLIVSKGRYYFIEINFRNGAYGYAVTKAGVNMPELWCLDAIGKNISISKTTINKRTTLMSEFADFKNIFLKKVNIIKWFSQYITADAHLIINRKDLKPFIFKFIYR
ncbi:ATP-grasp domain-containing protein [Lentibacillus sediminis]|uniref:ATP-grasp domain-containing protein n=1 Tax=Lentibacillus sediminis TaxID=1940529 RepID=UPI000C1B8E81|nr:ATP-grasp domain-containing protein [Lentibacillus sediminis]